MRRSIAIALLLAGCGRINFDLHPDAPGEARVFAYVIDGFSTATTTTTLRIYQVGADGELTETAESPFELGAQPVFVVGNAAGDRLYATTLQTGSIHTLAIDADTGALSSLDVDLVGTRPEMAAIHPSGSWLYVPDFGPDPNVHGFAIAADGSLSEIAGSPWNHAGDTSNWVEPHPDGRWCYVVDTSSTNLFGFEVQQETGALTVVPSIVWGSMDSGPWAALIESTGRFGFVAPDSSGGIPGFTIDRTTGAVSTTPGSKFGSSGNVSLNAAMDRDRRRFVVANDGNDTLSAFRIDQTTGSLAHLPGSPFLLPMSIVWSVATSPVSDDVYLTTTQASPGIVQFRATDTGLTQIRELTLPGLNRPSRLALVRTR